MTNICVKFLAGINGDGCLVCMLGPYSSFYIAYIRAWQNKNNKTKHVK